MAVIPLNDQSKALIDEVEVSDGVGVVVQRVFQGGLHKLSRSHIEAENAKVPTAGGIGLECPIVIDGPLFETTCSCSEYSIFP